MYNIFFTSDTHFSHENMCTFVNYDGSRMRPFSCAEECDELMIENWNKVVKGGDKVYCLGDMCFSRNKGDLILPRLQGNKCLIRGNHDKFKLNWYSKYFYDVRGCHNLDNFLLTHIPIHPHSKGRFKMNIHGHLHCEKVHKEDGTLDMWYRNVCMDSNSYQLVPYEIIQEEYNKLVEEGILTPPKFPRP